MGKARLFVNLSLWAIIFGKGENSPKKFERFKPLRGRPNRSIFFSDENYSFILLLKHSRMHNEAFQIISQETVVGCPWFLAIVKDWLFLRW